MADGFIFGQGTPWSYDELQRKRKIAEQMIAANQRTPQSVGEGLAAIGRALSARRIGKIADEREAELRGEFTSGFESLFSPSQAPSMPSDPMGLTGAPVGGESIVSGLVARGLPEHVAQGFVMNMQDESGLNPGINEIDPIVPGSRGGFGLSQWTGPRRVALENFARSQGRDVADPELQLDFLMAELQGPESSAMREIMATNDAGSAAAAIARSYLRPAQEHLDRRVAKYTGGGGVAQPQADPQQIMALMSSPFATDAQKAYLGAMLQRSMPMTEAERLDMDLKRAQLAATQTPKDTRTSSQKDYEFYERQERAAGRQPLSFGEWSVMDERASVPGPDTGKFSEEAAKVIVDEAKDVMTAGSAAARNLGRIQRMTDLMETSPQGLQGAITGFAGEFGVDIGGLDQVQALTAVINSMVPEQRAPGSGPMSDADLALFKQSLPRLINTPGGNKMIAETMRAVAEYDIAMGEVARKLLLNELTPREAFDEYAKIGDPLAGFMQSRMWASQEQPAGPPAPSGVLKYNPATGEFE